MTSSSETELAPGGHLAHQGKVRAILRGEHQGRGMTIGVVCGLFNGQITHQLLTGVLEALAGCGVGTEDITVAWVPGAYEIPLMAQQLARSGRDAVICLGAVIRGDTPHFDFVAGECASGLSRVQLDTSVPTIFGVLTVDTVAQALERSAPGVTNKGYEAAMTAVEMANLLRDPRVG